jgi:hypothetical protein
MSEIIRVSVSDADAVQLAVEADSAAGAPKAPDNSVTDGT